MALADMALADTALGAGSPALSSLPFGVSGIFSKVISAAGTM